VNLSLRVCLDLCLSEPLVNVVEDMEKILHFDLKSEIESSPLNQCPLDDRSEITG